MSSERSAAVERLKVRSPRLDQDEFELTPSGRPDRPDARRLDQRTKSSRATSDDNPRDDPGEQATLLDAREVSVDGDRDLSSSGGGEGE